MKRIFVFLAMVCGALFQSENARATCCNTDADCPRGITCAGGTCDAVTSCTCDTDCGPSLYCIPAVFTVCSGTAAQDCHPEGRCASAWQRPCGTAADCGPGGFTCVANGQLCSDAGCQTTSTCKPPPLPTTCATNSDCPTAWTCEPDTALITACVSVTQHCPADGCPPPTGAKSCVPPMFDLVGTLSYAGPPVVLPASCSAAGAGGYSPGAGGSGAAGSTGATGTTGCQLVPGAPADSAFFLGASGLLGASLLQRTKRSRVRCRSRAPVAP